MRILVVASCLPQAEANSAARRLFHQLTHLAASHEVRLLALARRSADRTAALSVPSLGCDRVEIFHDDGLIDSGAGGAESSGTGGTRAYFYPVRALGARVRQVADEWPCDVVVVQGTAVAAYARLVKGVPAVLDLPQLESAGMTPGAQSLALRKRLLSYLKLRRFRGREATVLSSFKAVTVASLSDLSLPGTMSSAPQPILIRDGLDESYFGRMNLAESESPCLIFSGAMNSPANSEGVRHFARTVFPRLRQRVGDLEFLVIGRSPTHQVKALENIPGIQVLGAVGDLRSFFARAWAFVLPERIVDVQHCDVFQAVASKLPLVCGQGVVRLMAQRGLEPEQDYLQAPPDRDGMVGAVSRLLESSELRKQIGLSGHQCLAQEENSWAMSTAKFGRVLLDIVESSGAEARSRRVVARGSLAPYSS